MDMEDQIVPEGLNEWQQIDSDNSPFSTTDISESPPSDHDYASFVIKSEPSDSSPSLSGPEISESESESNEAETEAIAEVERRRRRRLVAVGSEIIMAACKVKDQFVSSISGLKAKIGISILISSAASGALVLVLVSWLYAKIQRRQRIAQLETTEKFIILIKEKDLRINQLLQQISQMNDLLQARRKVPIIRIGSS